MPTQTPQQKQPDTQHPVAVKKLEAELKALHEQQQKVERAGQGLTMAAHKKVQKLTNEAKGKSKDTKGATEATRAVLQLNAQLKSLTENLTKLQQQLEK